MKSELYVIAKYCGYYKLIGLPFRPMKDDKIIDQGIEMNIVNITINKDIQDGIIVDVRIAYASYHDQEELYIDMKNKGWR